MNVCKKLFPVCPKTGREGKAKTRKAKNFRVIRKRDNSGVNNGQTLAMTNHLQALVGKIKVKIAEMPQQQR